MPTLPSSNTVTMTISLDKTATLSRSTYIGNQGEQLVITVVVPTGISGSGYDAYIDFTQPDGLSYFKGPYDCSTGTFDFTLGALDSIMDKDGVIYWQFLLCTTVGDVRTVNWSAKRYKTEILSSVGATTSAILPYVPQMVFPDTYPAGNITIADVGGILVGNTVEDALQEVEGQIVDIASTNINKGASLVGIHDIGNIITAVNAEDAIQENAANINLVEGRMTTAEDNITTLQTNPAYVLLSLNAPFTNYGGVYGSSRCCKTLDGIVSVDMCVSYPGSTAALITTLPVGYRPPNRVKFAVVGIGSLRIIRVDSDGTINYESGTTGDIQITISFPSF